MLIANQKVKVKWNAKFKKYYEDKGYKYTKMKDEFDVDVKDLPLSSKSMVLVKCDYCGKEFQKRYQNYNSERNKRVIKKDCCKQCSTLKRKEYNLQKYGVENVFQSKEIKDKIRQICLEKYGVENYTQTNEYKEKSRQTCLEKYGVENYTQTNEYKEKSRQTCLEKYGVENAAQSNEVKEKIQQTCLKKYGMRFAVESDIVKNKIKQTHLNKTNEEKEQIKEKRRKTNIEIYGVENTFQSEEKKEKIKQTCLEKYGVEYVSQNKEIKIKQIIQYNKTIYKNETGPCSKQQKHIFDLIGGELNYPVSRCLLDIAFPKEMIYIEYNGGGHTLGVKTGKITQEEFDKKELNRYSFLKRQGWKLIKIICNFDKLPSDEQIIKQIEKSKEELKNKNWVELNWDTDPNTSDPLV